jgi:hypothetical protein
MWSLLATMHHEDLVFQATVAILSPVAAAHTGCRVAASPWRSVGVRSWAKFSLVPGGVMLRKPAAVLSKPFNRGKEMLYCVQHDPFFRFV